LLRPTSAGPHGLRSSSEFWFHRPGRGLPTASLGIRPGCAVAADIAAVATFTLPDLPAPPSTSSPASTPASTLLPSLWSRGANLEIAFRPHRFARSRRFAPPIAPLSRDFALLPAQDSRACCIPLPILGFAAFRFVVRVAPAPHTGHLAMVYVQPVTRTPRPRSAVHTLWRIPPTRSRVVSPRSLPPWCSLPAQPRSIRRDRYRLRRSCHDHVMQHLRGVAPQMGPYQQPPFPAALWPTLPGLWSPSRSFDPGIAPEADASRTQCAGIPARRFRSSFRRRVRPFGQRVAPFRPRFFVARSPTFRLGIPPSAMVARGSSRRLR
jgi:hypothetical protein